MANKKEMNFEEIDKMLQEESNVNQINTFVSNSEDEAYIDENIALEADDEKTRDPDRKNIEIDYEKKKDPDRKIIDLDEENVDTTKKEIMNENKKIEQIDDKKPAVSYPKQQYEKNIVKSPIRKEEKMDTKVSEPKSYAPHKNNHVESKVTPQKKLEVKKEEKTTKNYIKKSREVTNMKKTKQQKNNGNGKEHKKKYRLTKNTFIWIGIGILAAVLVIAIVLLVSSKNNGNTEGNQTIKSVAATVNGEAIYLQDIQTEYDSLNPVLKRMYTLESILDNKIDSVLLGQESKNEGITISEKEIQDGIDSLKEQNQLTNDQFEQALETQNITLEDVKDIIRKNLMIQKFLNNSILQNISITESNIEAYYNLNIEKFVTPDQVTVQHILILVTPNVTDTQAKSKIEQIEKEMSSTNFCDLVTKYSEDPGSLETCGEYTFAKGDFNNPEFENPSFDLKVGEHAIINTSFGYHLINKLANLPSRTMNLSEVSKNINATLYDETAQKNFDALMTELRSKAVIVNYMTKIEGNESVLVPLETTSLDDFAKCLTEKGAKFYGASWCSHCNNQKKGFGDSLQYVTYIECADEDNPQVQTEACNKAGISGYPTWIINDKQYPGEQALADLARLTGCNLPE
jgi:parvulin-like peptidyl-prolyl isomerase